MATGNFENWVGTISEMGPLYPFVGTEKILAIAGVVAWIVWHIIQAKRENQHYAEQERKFGDAESLKKLIGREDPRHP